MELDFQDKFRKAIMEIEKTGKDYALAKGISWQLQEMRKVVLADQIRTFDPEKSVSERENAARTTQEYKTHLEGTKEAIQNELQTKIMYEKATATFEALRSLCSLTKKTISEFNE